MEEIEYDELETCELSEDEKELNEDNDVEVDHDCVYYILNCCSNCHISLLGLLCCFLCSED
tara:strand:- start:1218 stop:1400 length:183 start_codon:yes stop_codon:yes gene_type:complete